MCSFGKTGFSLFDPSLILSLFCLLIILCSTTQLKWYSGGYHFSSHIYIFLIWECFCFIKLRQESLFSLICSPSPKEINSSSVVSIVFPQHSWVGEDYNLHVAMTGSVDLTGHIVKVWHSFWIFTFSLFRLLLVLFVQITPVLGQGQKNYSLIPTKFYRKQVPTTGTGTD